jgi:integrase
MVVNADAPVRLAPRPLAAVPVEYAVAVDHYLAGASLGAASRRIYRISLTSWAWALVGRRPPRGARRRGATPPIVPLALLDDIGAAALLAAAVADRAAVTDARTVNREVSALRSAVGWWRDQRWIDTDPTAGLRHMARTPVALPALTQDQVARLFRAPASLREQAFWRVLHDCGARVEDVLALDAGRLDLPGNRARIEIEVMSDAGPAAAGASWLQWQSQTSEMLGWLVAGRAYGPVFLTDRRAPTRAGPPDICPITGRARMSYRRAAEIFTASTRPLDPAGRGWTLHQLQLAGLADRPGGS